MRIVNGRTGEVIGETRGTETPAEARSFPMPSTGAGKSSTPRKSPHVPSDGHHETADAADNKTPATAAAVISAATGKTPGRNGVPQSVLAAFDKSVRAAVRNGRCKRVDQAALIEAGRRLAAYMDQPGWPQVGDRWDNASAGTLLKYCQALGITPDAPEGNDKKAPSKLERLRALDGGGQAWQTKASTRSKA